MPDIAHIAENIGDRGLLLIRERKRQRLAHGTHASAHSVRKRRDVEKVAVVSKAQRELQVHGARHMPSDDERVAPRS